MSEMESLNEGEEWSSSYEDSYEAELVFQALERQRHRRRPANVKNAELNKPMHFFFRHEGHAVSLFVKPRVFGAMEPLDRLVYAVGFGATFAATAEHLADYVDKMLDKGVQGEDLLSFEQKQELHLQALEQGYLRITDQGLRLEHRAHEIFDKKVTQTGWRDF